MKKPQASALKRLGLATIFSLMCMLHACRIGDSHVKVDASQDDECDDSGSTPLPVCGPTVAHVNAAAEAAFQAWLVANPDLAASAAAQDPLLAFADISGDGTSLALLDTYAAPASYGLGLTSSTLPFSDAAAQGTVAL